MATFRKSFEEILASQNASAPRRKPRDEEHQIQCACVKWFNLQYPQYRGLLFAVPNGGARSKATAGKLKAEGVVAGVADLILLVPGLAPKTPKEIEDSIELPFPYHCNIVFRLALCIEMKTKTGRQTEAQKEWKKKVERHDYRYEVCRSLEEFQKVVREHLTY